jgi:hypothetical protein
LACIWTSLVAASTIESIAFTNGHAATITPRIAEATPRAIAALIHRRTNNAEIDRASEATGPNSPPVVTRDARPGSAPANVVEAAAQEGKQLFRGSEAKLTTRVDLFDPALEVPTRGLTLGRELDDERASHHDRLRSWCWRSCERGVEISLELRPSTVRAAIARMRDQLNGLGGGTATPVVFEQLRGPDS